MGCSAHARRLTGEQNGEREKSPVGGVSDSRSMRAESRLGLVVWREPGLQEIWLTRMVLG